MSITRRIRIKVTSLNFFISKIIKVKKAFKLTILSMIRPEKNNFIMKKITIIDILVEKVTLTDAKLVHEISRWNKRLNERRNQIVIENHVLDVINSTLWVEIAVINFKLLEKNTILLTLKGHSSGKLDDFKNSLIIARMMGFDWRRWRMLQALIEMLARCLYSKSSPRSNNAEWTYIF